MLSKLHLIQWLIKYGKGQKVTTDKKGGKKPVNLNLVSNEFIVGAVHSCDEIGKKVKLFHRIFLK